MVAWSAMAQLAFAGGVSSLLPMPLFAGTLGAVFQDARTLSTKSASAYQDLTEPPGLTRQFIIATTGISSSSSSKADSPVDLKGIDMYADMYLYAQAACYLVVLQAGLLLAASMSVVALVDVLLVRVHYWLLQAVFDIPAAFEVSSPLHLMKRALPSAGQVWQQMLPALKQWWSNLDLQLDDFVYVACSFSACSHTYLKPHPLFN